MSAACVIYGNTALEQDQGAYMAYNTANLPKLFPQTHDWPTRRHVLCLPYDYVYILDSISFDVVALAGLQLSL